MQLSNKIEGLLAVLLFNETLPESIRMVVRKPAGSVVLISNGVA